MRTLPVLLATTALLAAACSGGEPSAGPTDTSDPADEANAGGATASGQGGAGSTTRFVRGLARFDDCAAFLGHIQAEARDRVGPYGFDQYMGGMWDVGRLMFAEEPAEEAADAPSSPGAPSMGSDDSVGSGKDPDFTGTNVQVAGVDEPDLVKTDGRRILTVSDNVLSLVDITSGTPVVTGKLRLPNGWQHELFFRGDRALVFTNTGTWGIPIEALDDAGGDAGDEAAADPRDRRPAAEIIEVDLSDPTNLRIVASMQIDGQYLSARAIDDHVRLAVTSAPSRLPWLYPQSSAGVQRALEANRATIDSSTIEDWLPEYRLTRADGTTRGTLLDCGNVHHPADFAGFDVVSVIDLDLAEGLRGAGLEPSANAVGVLASGQTVSASMDRFYVATTRWLPPSTGDESVDDDWIGRWSEDFVTEIHAFATSPGSPTTYVASGSVPGTLLNQFSLDEHRGDLRVVHTEGSPWNEQNLSETFLTVLREDGDRLVEIGSVGGLGRGERLYSARLMGDVGFAVTFREIDPFYVLDLSDPTDPRVTGELKIPGFSTYLHPLGDDLVLGIGQDALETGQVMGLKLSLFDVSDRTDPREVSVWTLRDANSAVEWDHRAFQVIGRTAIVPVQSWRSDVNGAIVFDLGNGIREIGRVSHTSPAETSTDCRVIDPSQLTPDASDLYWVALEGRVQVCNPGAVGGWSGGYCDSISSADIEYWWWDDDARTSDLETLGVQQGDIVQLCWPDGGYQESILRSLVADDVLYTISPSTLQANDFATLDLVGAVEIR